MFEAGNLNAAAYSDARGAGGMYTKISGYFEWNDTGHIYTMTKKRYNELERFEKMHGPVKNLID
jgi:hypothetical protein